MCCNIYLNILNMLKIFTNTACSAGLDIIAVRDSASLGYVLQYLSAILIMLKIFTYAVLEHFLLWYEPFCKSRH